MNTNNRIGKFFKCKLIFICLFLSEPLLAGNSSDAVLNRNQRLDVLSADFEQKWQWNKEREREKSGAWRGSGRGAPTRISRIKPPPNGLSGSTGALQLRTKRPDGDFPFLDDLVNPGFESRLGRPLTRRDQPVFIVRIWLPPFDQWQEEKYNIGFRLGAHSEKLAQDTDRSGSYYPSIWLVHSRAQAEMTNKQDKHYARWNVRIGTGLAHDQDVGPIPQAGWWTLALAFDEDGVGHYYARPGVEPPNEEDRFWDTIRFEMEKEQPTLMDSISYNFFSLSTPTDGSLSPPFAIDGYEVWIDGD